MILVVALAKGMKWASLKEALLETAKLTVMIFALIWGVLIFVRFLGYAGLPQEFAGWISGLPFPPVVVMILILCGYAVLGMFMDAIGMLLLTLPVVYPAVIALGYDPIWFGIFIVIMVECALITPPVGLNLYVIQSIAKCKLGDVAQGVLPFLIMMIFTVPIMYVWTDLALFTPFKL